MNVWIVNPFDPLPGEPPKLGGRYATITDTLIKHGHRVVWWTATWYHYSKIFRQIEAFKQTDNFKIVFISTPSYRKNISISRLYNHYMYGNKFKSMGMKYTDSPDIILASFPPIESVASAITIARRRSCKVVIDIQDLWPEAFLLAFPTLFKPLAKNLLKPLFWKVRRLMNESDGLMAVSDEYLNIGKRRCKTEKPSLTLHLGIDLEVFDSLKNLDGTSILKKKPGEKWIIYIGTMGAMYDLDTILKSALYFKDQSQIRFIFAGDGPELYRAKEVAKKDNLNNVYFAGSLNLGELRAVLAQSDIGINAIATGAPIFFPNKVFDYLAAGLPVINSIQGELQDVLRRFDAGVFYKSGDSASLVDAINILLNDEERRKRMAYNARQLVEEKYDRNKTYPTIIPFFEKVLETS